MLEIGLLNLVTHFLGEWLLSQVYFLGVKCAVTNYQHQSSVLSNNQSSVLSNDLDACGAVCVGYNLALIRL